MSPKYSPILWRSPTNIHKIFIPTKKSFFWKPPKILKFKILNPQKLPEPTYVWKYQSTPWGCISKLGVKFTLQDFQPRQIRKQGRSLEAFAHVQKVRKSHVLARKAFRASFSLTGAIIYEPRHEISNNMVCATSKCSDQPAHTRSLIRAFSSRLNILWLVSYGLNIIWSF